MLDLLQLLLSKETSHYPLNLFGKLVELWKHTFEAFEGFLTTLDTIDDPNPLVTSSPM